MYLGKAQSALKCRFHNIVGFFHLPFGTRITRLVDLHMHIQGLAQIFKRRRSIRTAWVKHDHARYAAKRVFSNIFFRLHHIDEKITEVRAGFAAEVITHRNRTGGMVCPRVPPDAVVFDFDDVFRLVFIKLLFLHHPQPRILALTRQVIQNAQTRVDLPTMVRVFRFHAADGFGLQKLVGMQLVFP